MVKAVSFCESSISCICQNPEEHCENVGVRSANVADAFGDFFHEVYMGVLVEPPEILHNAKSLALFLWNAENG